MISQLFIPIAGTILFYVLFHALSIVYRELTSPLRYMAGPKTRSFLLGNSQEMMVNPLVLDHTEAEIHSGRPQSD
jgi:hypothetical protein